MTGMRSIQASTLSRRAVIGALPLSLTSPSVLHAAEPGAPLRFEARRNGRRIGEQQTTFAREGEVLVVRIIAEFAVKVGPVALYRYRHQATERWEAGRFTHMDARTDQNGRTIQVTAAAAGGGVRIRGPRGESMSAPQASPFSHWNLSAIRRPLFNPQDGTLLREGVSGPTPAVWRLADGSDCKGLRVRFSGDAEIDDYYDQSGTWAGLSGKLSDGSRLDYHRL